jgi:hypothetical protein
VGLADLADLAALEDRAALVDPANLADLVASVGLANLADLAELEGLAALVGLANLVDPVGLADLANLSGSTDQSIEEMLLTQTERRPTSLADGLNSSPRADLLIGPVSELVPAAELEPVGQEEVESPLVHRVERRLAPVAELEPGHLRAQLPVVAGTV